ncbi:cytochrome P450 1A1 [Gastrophryne carolinensis]
MWQSKDLLAQFRIAYGVPLVALRKCLHQLSKMAQERSLCQQQFLPRVQRLYVATGLFVDHLYVDPQHSNMINLTGYISETSTTELLLASVVMSVMFLILKQYKQKVPKGTKPMPGPMPLPLIGNLLSISKNPYLSLTKMSQTYGDVFQIQIGTKPVLVLNGLETIRQALLKQGDVFIGRPDLFTFRLIGDGQSLTFSHDSGEVWKARRRLAHNALKSFAIAPSATSNSNLVEEHISKEAAYLVSKFQQLMEEKGEFEPYRYVVVSVANVICAMCFGKRYSHDDQTFLELVNLTDEFGAAAASGNPADFIPILQYLPSQTMKNFVEINKKFTNFTSKIIQEHYRTFDKNAVRDITDSLILQSLERTVDENSDVQQLSDKKIVSIVNDLVGAGFDTITTALSWSLMYLVAHPQIQDKLQNELDQVIGRERRPKLSDRAQLPYTEAFILEMFRHSSFLPFTIPHCTTSDTVLNGYFIPKGICVMVNQWQVNHDPNLWKDPYSFCPERFLNADGSSINKTEMEKVLIFGLGKRRCLGEAIGRMEVFLFLTIMLQQMQFSLQDGEKLDMSPQYGLTMKHKRHYLTCKLRFPMMGTQ